MIVLFDVYQSILETADGRLAEACRLHLLFGHIVPVCRLVLSTCARAVGTATNSTTIGLSCRCSQLLLNQLPLTCVVLLDADLSMVVFTRFLRVLILLVSIPDAILFHKINIFAFETKG